MISNSESAPISVSTDPGVKKDVTEFGRVQASSASMTTVGLRVDTFETAQELLQSKRLNVPGRVVLDVRLPGLSGLEL